MVPKTARQVRWLIVGIWGIVLFGSIAILSVPAFFGGYVPFWVPIVSILVGTVTYAVCLRQSRRP